MSFGSRPIRKGFRYSSTAVTTANGRCVKVAQPIPYNPGSLVSTFTTTRRMPSGAVQIAFTLVIRNAGIPPVGSQAGGMVGSADGVPDMLAPYLEWGWPPQPPNSGGSTSVRA